MTRPGEPSDFASERSFSHVYDALYSGDPPFLQAQLAFLSSVFDSPPGRLLDAGCGTGTHLVALTGLGYSVAGVDNDPLMLQTARRKAPGASLVLGDLRRLPFRRAFGGALCLESPLAYLLDDVDLASALRSLYGALCDQGKLVVDVYDYVGMLGTRGIRPQVAHFQSNQMRVTVRESHRYEKKTGIWTMEQEFAVEQQDRRIEFGVIHRLRMRTLDEYAQELECVGFTIVEALTGFPGAPAHLRDERRLILVARR